MSDESSSSSFEHENKKMDNLNQGGKISSKKIYAFDIDDEWNRDIELAFYKKKDSLRIPVENLGVEPGEHCFKVKFKRHMKKKKFWFVVARRGIRILDFRTREELTRFSFDRVLKFLYNSELRVFQFTIKLNSVSVERYTFYTKSAEEIFFTIKDFVAQNIAEGVGKTKKLVQARVDRIHTGHDHKAMTIDEENRGVSKREVTDVIERTAEVSEAALRRKKSKPTLLDITTQTEDNMLKNSKKAKSARIVQKKSSEKLSTEKSTKRSSRTKSARGKSARKEVPDQLKSSRKEEEDHGKLSAKNNRSRSKSIETRSTPTPTPIDVHNVQVKKLKSSTPFISLEDSDMEILDL